MSLEAAITQEGGAPPGGIPVRVRRALVSVSDKTGVVDFARGLRELGVEVLSTGGTAAAIREAGLEVTDVAEFTGSPEILDGRVKTLHPRLHAALLARRDDTEHMATLEAEEIEPIDLVCVNLYPFERTIETPGVTEREAVENIDIGGPTMIRAAAKNHSGVAVVVKPEAYDAVLEELRESGGEISTETRQWLANEAFAHTAAYDAAISRWFGARYEAYPNHFVMPHDKFMDLPYGENPHQKAALYIESGAGQHHVLAGVVEAARQAALVQQHPRPRFGSAAARRVRRAGVRDRQAQQPVRDGGRLRRSTRRMRRRSRATRCPRSAGVLVFNRPIDAALAERLHQQFIEVLFAPGFGRGAMEVLTRKEAIRILEVEELSYVPRERDVKRVRGGLLVQDPDRIDETRETMEVATSVQPTEAQWDDLIFAWKVCRHVRSNAIVFAKDGATVGIGAGQMSRVDSVRIAVEKASDAFGEEAGDRLGGSVVASDAFYPFPDGPLAAIAAGATVLIQPGGSKRDGEVIAACDEAGAAMVLTGRRHFRH